MRRFLHACLLGLVGAGIVHITVLLLVPLYSQKDAWSALSQQANFYRVTRLDPAGRQPLIDSLDPLFQAVACRFDLSEGVVRLSGEGTAPYWSVSVYDRTGQNVFSLNDRSASSGQLDFVIATPVQMIELRNAIPVEFDASVFIEANLGEGIVVARAFTPDESRKGTVAGFLEGLNCELH